MQTLNIFPPFAENLDDKFLHFNEIFIIGDLHDHEKLFRTLLDERGIAFVPNTDVDDFRKLENYFVKSDILLVFLGDVLYKTPDHFKSIMRFILNNTENCILILGNNEVKFILERIKLFTDFAKPFMSQKFLRLLESFIRKKESFKLLNSIYSIISKLRCPYKHNWLKCEWNWFYSCLYKDFLTDKKNNEDLMFVMYILTKSVVMGVSNRYKLLLCHAGFNPTRSLHRQRIFDVCNIRRVKQTKQPWYVYYSNIAYTIVFGHWSALTKETNKPYVYKNAICLDTECWRSQNLSYICIRSMQSDLSNLENLVIKTQYSSSKLYTFHEVLLQSELVTM